MAAAGIPAVILTSEAKLRVWNLILRSEAQPRVSKDGPEGDDGSARTEASFEAPLGRLRTRGCEGNSDAAFPIVPHSHPGPSVYAIGLAGQGATQDVGIIPQAVLLFAGRVSAAGSVSWPPARSRPRA